MSTWDELLSAAIVGVDRRPPPWTTPTGPLGDLVAGLGERPPATRLLTMAAVVALHARAGRRPALDPRPTPAPCSLDDQARCAAAATMRLARLLAGEQPALLLEWLAALAVAGRRVPETSLPALLDLGRREAALREQIRPVLGARGRWLAQQNPDWTWAVDADDGEAVWQTGGRAARLDHLRHRRRHAPEEARALLASTWADEAADDRAAFLGTLADGLSHADEPFLEAALDDRRKEVRVTAADLLARLPESALVQRTIERLRPRLRFEAASQSGLRKLLPGRRLGRLTVVLPDGWTCDPAMIRDGIQPTPPAGLAIGQQAWWLQQMLGIVPPSHWLREWQQTPADLLEIASAGDWPAPLVAGWLAATIRHRDAGWAEAILARTPDQAGLLPLLPVARQEAILIAALQAHRGTSIEVALLWRVQEWRGAWSEALARAVLDYVRRSVRQGDTRHAWQVRQFLTQQCAIALPPSLRDEVAAGWPTSELAAQTWQPAIDALVTTLQFRHDMLKEIAE